MLASDGARAAGTEAASQDCYHNREKPAGAGWDRWRIVECSWDDAWTGEGSEDEAFGAGAVAGGERGWIGFAAVSCGRDSLGLWAGRGGLAAAGPAGLGHCDCYTGGWRFHAG